MIYFGANDGMLHAACATVAGACQTPGQELWAYLPRTEIPLLRYNQQLFEGSVRVVELFADWYGNGAPSFKTVLTFMTGTGTTALGPAVSAAQAPAVYTIDVTDPASPRVLWEYTVPNLGSMRAHELGIGLTLAMGNVTTAGGALHPEVYAETTNGNTLGSAGAGVTLMALDGVTGAELWGAPFGFDYINGIHGDGTGSGSAMIPPVPSPASPVARSGSTSSSTTPSTTSCSPTSTATCGNSIRSTAPTTTAAANRCSRRASTATRSVRRRVSTRSRGTSTPRSAPAATPTSSIPARHALASANAGQFAFAVDLDAGSGGLSELSASTTFGLPDVVVLNTFGAGVKVFAQITIVGSQLFVTADSGDVNSQGYGAGANEGQLATVNMNTTGTVASSTIVSIAGGASAVGASATQVISSTANKIEVIGAPTSTNGSPIDGDSSLKPTRLLFLRTE